jgi:UDP-N-acetylmuramoyl-tripeptide--D-alanyl-D-alanine ligase
MVVVANADDALVMRHVGPADARVVTFGSNVGATVRMTDVVDHGLDGTEARFETPAGTLAVTLALPGHVQLSNAAAAVAVALHFDVSLADIATRLGSVRPVGRRGGQVTLPSGVRLVDDSYNASPEATTAMLEALGRTSGAGRRVAVLGEMLELGSLARAQHEACGRAAAQCAVDVLVVIGGAAADGLVDGAISGGMPADRIHRFADSPAAADAIGALLEPGDVVLVKGSRGTRTEIVVDRLVEAA